MIFHRAKPKWSRRRRIVLILAAAVAVLPILLLHVAAWMFSFHDRVMKGYASHVIADESGHTIRYYELEQPGADWNIVFIHGTPATGAIFGEQFRHPFPGANLFSLDRPGFGASAPALRRPSLRDQAAAVGALLERLPRKRTILVGHSYGGPVALLAAVEFTNKVAGVVLVGGSVDPGQEHVYTIQHFADWPAVAWLEPRALRQCNRELLTLRSDLVDLKARLPSLSVPVVLLHGGRDQQVPVANVDYLRAQLAAAGRSNLCEALVYPDYNHFIPWEHPDAVTKAILRAMENTRTASQMR